MIRRLERFQLLAFVLVSVVGVALAAVQYLEVPRLLGLGSDRVTLTLPTTGGLYPNAIVTYRGVHVGKVTSVDVDRNGVAVVLSVDRAAAVPANSSVSVHSTSAIGENYIDFEPRGQSAPLRDGQTLAADQVAMPVPATELLESWQRFASTLPLDKLNRTMVETQRVFDGAGPPVTNFLRSAKQLQDLANANFDPSTRLLHDLVPVLATQQRLGPDIRSSSADLASVTGTLRSSDADIRGTIDRVPPFADQVGSLFNEVSPTLPQLLTDLTSTGQVLRVYVPNLRHVLTVLPATMGNLTTVGNNKVPEYGESPAPVAGANFKLGFNDPPACVTGYERERVAPSDISNSTPPAAYSWCKEPHDSPLSVRGLRNSPCPAGSPAGPGSRGATAAECGWHFQTPKEAEEATAAAIKFQLAVAARNPKTRAESEAYIGKDRPPRPPKSKDSGPGINEPDGAQPAPGPAAQDQSGLFVAGGQPWINGNRANPMPIAGGSGLQRYLFATLTPPP